MSRDWRKYNEELIKRGEILIDPEGFGVKAEKQEDHQYTQIS